MIICSRSATSNVNPSASVGETPVVTPHHIAPSTSTTFVQTSSSDAQGFNLYQTSFHHRLQLPVKNCFVHYCSF